MSGGITIDGLEAGPAATLDQVIPAMSGGATVKLTLDQIAQLVVDTKIEGVYLNAEPATMGVFFRTTAPVGWLKANGALLSRTTYSALWQKAQEGGLVTSEVYWPGAKGYFSTGDGSTNFRIPDLRGEFIRVWDDGAGIDSGRVIGGNQAGQNLSHNHTVNDPGHAHSVYDPTHLHTHLGPNQISETGYGLDAGSTSYNRRVALTSTQGAFNTITGAAAYTGIAIYGAGTGIYLTASGGGEARPRNIALLHCIKY